jgi:hypothetical protein
MRWWLITDNDVIVEISFTDMLKVSTYYPEAMIIPDDRLGEYLEMRRTKMIYG